jgi:hypothetical protein
MCGYDTMPSGNSAAMRWNSGQKLTVRRSHVHLQGDESRLSLHELGLLRKRARNDSVLSFGTTKVLPRTRPADTS